VYATRRFYAQAPQLLSGANFDLAGAHRVSKQGCANEVGPSITLPSSTAKREPCHGHFTLSPSNSPSESGRQDARRSASFLPTPRFS